MKNLTYALLFLFFWQFSFSQVVTSSNSGVQAARSSTRHPMMDFLMSDVKSNDELINHYVGAEVGTAYENESFQTGKVFYNKEELGDVQYRLNAYNNEIELKITSLNENKSLALVKNEELKIIDGTKEIVYRTFMDNTGKIGEGYLTVLRKGDEYNLYRRLYKKFTEPRPAGNSMVAPTPSRFTDYLSYYYQKTGKEEILEIPLKPNKFFKLFDEDTAKNLKKLVKEKDFNLDHENDLVSIFKEID